MVIVPPAFFQNILKVRSGVKTKASVVYCGAIFLTDLISFVTNVICSHELINAHSNENKLKCRVSLVA